MASSPSPQRAYATDVSLRFGTEALSPVLKVDAVPQGRPNARDDDSFTGICPDHDVPTKVSQRYVCPDHGTFSQSELIKARDTGEGLVPFTDEEIKSVKSADFAEKILTFTQCPAAAVDAASRPGSLGYRLRSAKTATDNERKLYAIVVAAARDNKVAFVGELRLRQTRTLFRLSVWNDQLLLTELITDLAPADAIPVGLDAASLKRGVASLKELVPVAEFDPANFGHDVVAAINAVIAVKGKAATSMPAAVVAPDEQDVIALLEASLPKPKAKRKLKVA